MFHIDCMSLRAQHRGDTASNELNVLLVHEHCCQSFEFYILSFRKGTFMDIYSRLPGLPKLFPGFLEKVEITVPLRKCTYVPQKKIC